LREKSSMLIHIKEFQKKTEKFGNQREKLMSSFPDSKELPSLEILPFRFSIDSKGF
jgi:hypothetical protein